MHELIINAMVQYNNMINMSDEETTRMVKGLRARRVANKAIENQNKKPLDSPDVLNADDFTFEPFDQKRDGDGDSGELLLATRKTDKTDKYIVKHAFCDCAANEYVYYNMAKAVDLTMPEVKLFRLSDPFDDTLFKTEYVAGIKYLNIVEEHADDITAIRASNDYDYYGFFGLHKIFLENDLVHIVLADDKTLYRIDCSDAFGIEDTTLMFAGVEQSAVKSDEDKKNQSRLNTLWFRKHWDLYDISRTMEQYRIEFGYNEMGGVINPLKAVRFVRKPYIDKFLETLCYFYPDCVGEYYSGFFVELKRAMRKIAPYLIEKYS